MNSIFEINFIDFIKKNGIIAAEDNILIAYSGGLDSTCLLYLLHKFSGRFNIKINALYLNHQIRSEGELKDEIDLIKKNCEASGVELIIETADVNEIARSQCLSVEEAARKTRYGLLDKKARELNCNKIATAHHLDDSAETVFLKLIKGASPSALSGIKETVKNIIRPLMFAKRNEIEKYARENNLVFSTDSTNVNIDYERNFVRSKIMPLVKELNPNFADALSSFHDIQKQENDLIDSIVYDFYKKHCFEDNGRVSVPAEEFQNLHMALRRRLLLHISRVLNACAWINYGSLSGALDYIEKNGASECREISKGAFYISKTARFDPAKKYNASSKTIIFTSELSAPRFGESGFESIKINAGETKTISCGGFNYIFTLASPSGKFNAASRGPLACANGVSNGISESGGFLFAFGLPHDIAPPLVIRHCLPGDKMKLYGMKGRSQKLSDLFINEKIYGPLKKYIPVICTADGEIIAVCNIKLSEYVFALKPEAPPGEGSYLFSALSKEIL